MWLPSRTRWGSRPAGRPSSGGTTDCRPIHCRRHRPAEGDAFWGVADTPWGVAWRPPGVGGAGGGYFGGVCAENGGYRELLASRSPVCRTTKDRSGPPGPKENERGVILPKATPTGPWLTVNISNPQTQTLCLEIILLASTVLSDAQRQREGKATNVGHREKAKTIGCATLPSEMAYLRNQ